MNEAIALLEQAEELLARVARVSSGAALRELSDEDACALMTRSEAVGRLVDGVRAVAAAEVDDRSRYGLGQDGLAQRLGHAKGVHLVEAYTRVSQAEAARRIRLGSAVSPRSTLQGEQLPREYPAVAHALRSGSIGVEAASVIIRSLTQASRTAGPESVAAAERALVTSARTESADLVAVQARAWRETLDPDGPEPRDAEIRERRSFHLGREINGLTRFSGTCDSVGGALLRAVFADGSAPGVTPRFLSSEDGGEADGGTGADADGDGDADAAIVERVRDPRTREQRQYDIVMGTLTAGLRAAETTRGGLRPTVTVMAVTTLDALQTGRGVGWLDDVAEPVSAVTMQQLACDAGYQPILLGEAGEVLHLGHKREFFSTAQRKALAVRDGGCVWPQCQAPPSWCEAHHVIERANGGPTDIDNGALLCSAHHHMLHASEFTMAMIRGRPRLLAPPWLDPDQIWRPLGRQRTKLVA
ncbi:DUF222 domain-containing protein [Marisediminicola sp. LYQ85]|uniref:HNH endonuclease signature motif containing protein n=1 Tax=Marisediminicola sp. LYQ85 TaxID=3391062 RepID=UPI003983760F